MIRLEVFLEVELDHVLLAAEVAVVHRARLPRDVHLDLLAGPERGHGVDEGGDPLVRAADVVLDGLLHEELGAAVLALVQLVAPLLLLVVRLDVVDLADLERVLLATEAAVVLHVAVWMLPELVLDGDGDGLENLLTNITRDLGRMRSWSIFPLPPSIFPRFWTGNGNKVCRFGTSH